MPWALAVLSVRGGWTIATIVTVIIDCCGSIYNVIVRSGGWKFVRSDSCGSGWFFFCCSFRTFSLLFVRIVIHYELFEEVILGTTEGDETVTFESIAAASTRHTCAWVFTFAWVPLSTNWVTIASTRGQNWGTRVRARLAVDLTATVAIDAAVFLWFKHILVELLLLLL